MRHPESPAAMPGLEQSLRRYLTLARTCHELFSVSFGQEKPPEHEAMDALLRALGQGQAQPPARTPAAHLN
jgi:hypothetical protein